MKKKPDIFFLSRRRKRNLMQLIPGPRMRHLLILLASSATGQVPVPITCENAEKVSHSFIQPISEPKCLPNAAGWKGSKQREEDRLHKASGHPLNRRPRPD